MAELKRLLFGDGLMVPSLDGTKRVTIRSYRPEAHDFKKGETVIGEFKDGVDVLLTITADTQTKELLELKESEAQEDGFENRKDALQGLRRFYPTLTLRSTIAIIRYKIYEVDGVPVVRFNEHSAIQ